MLSWFTLLFFIALVSKKEWCNVQKTTRIYVFIILYIHIWYKIYIFNIHVSLYIYIPIYVIKPCLPFKKSLLIQLFSQFRLPSIVKKSYPSSVVNCCCRYIMIIIWSWLYHNAICVYQEDHQSSLNGKWIDVSRKNKMRHNWRSYIDIFGTRVLYFI